MKVAPLFLILALAFGEVRANAQATPPEQNAAPAAVVVQPENKNTLATWDLEANQTDELVIKLSEINTGTVGTNPKFFVNIGVKIEYRRDAKRTRTYTRELLHYVPVGEAPANQSKYVDQIYRVRLGRIQRELEANFERWQTADIVNLDLYLNFRRDQGLGSTDLGTYTLPLADALGRGFDSEEEFMFEHEASGFSVVGEAYSETQVDIAMRRAQRKRLEAGELEKLMLELRSSTDERMRSLEVSNQRMLDNFSELFQKVTELAAAGGGEGSALSTMPATIFLVRHAEKEGGMDPDLTPEGHKRAEALKKILQKVKIDAVFATEMKRTQQTVAPVCEATGLKAEIEPYHVSDELVQKLKSKYAGKTVLVATHSTSIPDFSRQLGFTEPLDVYAFGDLFVIQFVGNKPKLVANLHFGE
ncbi:MAG: histidine phosphatase family protein [Bacteriovoracia bacterium]